MKSKNRQMITVIKKVNLGMFPLFVQLGHKGLEKSQPTAIGTNNSEKTYVIPKDILRVSVSDPALYESIESIEFTYDKNG